MIIRSINSATLINFNQFFSKNLRITRTAIAKENARSIDVRMVIVDFVAAMRSDSLTRPKRH